MVAWTAKQALMLEMIWPLPWEVSVPVCREGRLRSALALGAGGSRWWQGQRGETDPLLGR